MRKRCADSRVHPSGFLADLSAVAEDNTHHGYDSGKEAAELWSLGAPSAAATAVFPPGRSLQQLQGEARRVRAQSADAKSAKDKTEQEGSAISLALNRKLAVLPESSECSCAHKNAWAIVTAARAQVLKEEGGEAAGGDVKAQADECPCRSALVGAVTQVLQEKLETLTEELGSSTSAALALQRALVSMRLPDALAGELTKELDRSLAKKAKKKTGVEKHAKEAKSEPADNAAPEAKPEVKQAEEPEAINVIVNNNMGDQNYNVTTSEAVNQSLPYFYGYRYPQAFVRGGQAPFKPPATFPWRSGKEEGGMNLIVNVNNYIMPKGGCYSTRCFQMRADKAQLRALKTKKAIHQLKRSASAASVASRVSAQKQRTQERVLQDRLNSAVNMLQKIGHESEAAKLGAAPKKQKTARSQDALEQERQRLVDTARTLENVARRKAAAIREHGALADSAKGRAVSTQGKMTQLFQLISGVNTRTARGSKGVSEADVLSHVDEWEEAQRDEMHNEDGFQLLRPKHGDMAAAAGRGYDGARENEFVGGRFNALTGGALKKVPDLEHFDLHSMLGRRGGMEEESDKDARNDLMGYYHSLQIHVKKKHLKHAGPNRRIGDEEARDDLSNFYDNEAAQEGLDVDEETGLKKGQTDPLYDLAANGRMQVKHALHRESARQARSDLSGFYKDLGRGFPKISPDRQRFKSTGAYCCMCFAMR